MKSKKNKIVLSSVVYLVLCFNSIASVVSDNDGAAFITKAEYDAMKIDFQSMLNDFNTGIDSKIEKAIQGYIDGIKSTSTTREATLSPGDYECINERYNSSDYTWRYKYGSPRISVNFMYGGPAYKTSTTTQGNLTTYRVALGLPAYDENKHSIHKLLIQNLNTTYRTAEWYGIGYNCNDVLNCYSTNVWGSSLAVSAADSVLTYFRPGYDRQIFNSTVVNHAIAKFGVGTAWNNIGYEYGPNVTDLQQNFGSIGNKKVILLSGNKKYLNFSLYPDQRNWGFYTTDRSDATAYEKLWQDITTTGNDMDDEILNCYITTDATSKGTFNYLNHNGSTLTLGTDKTIAMAKKFTPRSDAYGGADTTGHPYCSYPCLGFEESYITNWNQLYTTEFDAVANDSANDWCKSSFLRDASSYHVGIKNGVPLLKTIANNTKITLDINLRKVTYNIKTGAATYTTPTSNCYVWISDTPFNTTHPNNSNCLDFTPVDGTCRKTTASGLNKAVEIPASQGGVAKVQFTVPNIDRYVWIKWSTDSNLGGGVMTIPKTVICETSG